MNPFQILNSCMLLQILNHAKDNNLSQKFKQNHDFAKFTLDPGAYSWAKRWQPFWQKKCTQIGFLDTEEIYFHAIYGWLIISSLLLIRPDICHEYHELYSWRTNCHVEKFQLSMYDNCGEIQSFSTCGEISDVSTWQMWRNLKFCTYVMCVM